MVPLDNVAETGISFPRPVVEGAQGGMQGIPDTLTENLRVGFWRWRLPVSSRRADHAVAGMLIFGRAAGGPQWQVPLPQRVMNRQLTGVSNAITCSDSH